MEVRCNGPDRSKHSLSEAIYTNDYSLRFLLISSKAVLHSTSPGSVQYSLIYIVNSNTNRFFFFFGNSNTNKNNIDSWEVQRSARLNNMNPLHAYITKKKKTIRVCLMSSILLLVSISHFQKAKTLLDPKNQSEDLEVALLKPP